MVALQILVLTVGVRILLGELKAEQLFQPFFVEFHILQCLSGSFVYRFRTRPSQGRETSSTLVGTVKILSFASNERIFCFNGKRLFLFLQKSCAVTML